MDRNTILAYVLIFFVLIGWLWWADRLQKERQTTNEVAERMFPDSLKSSAPRAVPRQEPTPQTISPADPIRWQPSEFDRAEGAAPQTTQIAERIITITDSLYTAKISTKGANLVAWQLNTYSQKPDKALGETFGPPVELIPYEGYGVDVAVGPEGRESSLSGLSFELLGAGGSDRLEVGNSLTLAFAAEIDGRRITKTWTFHSDNYTADLAVAVDGDLGTDRLAFQWNGGIPMEQGNQVISSRGGPLAGQGLMMVGGDLETLDYSEERDSLATVGNLDWLGQKNRYFLSAFVPGTRSEQWDLKVATHGMMWDGMVVPRRFVWSAAPVGVGNRSLSGTVYMGPIAIEPLGKISEPLTQAVDLGWQIIRPISFAILWMFKLVHAVVPNFGLVIIVFSVLVKIIVYPLTHKSFEASTKMKTLQPKMQELKEKHADDSQKLNQEMMKLYKEEGFNPLSGCLPMILQMPIFFAIYAVLNSNIEFRHAEFIWWIDDLSAPDIVAHLPFSLPMYGSHVSILPFVMAGSMFIQQQMMTADPRQKMMMYIMPVFMLMIFNNMASGLVLYWTMFNVLSSIQQLIIKRKQDDEGDTNREVAPVAMPKALSKGRKKLPGSQD